MVSLPLTTLRSQDGSMNSNVAVDLVEDDPRSGRPSDAVNPTSIAAVEK